MDNKEEQSSDNIDQEMPFVTALTTPFPQSNAGPHAETLSKIKERERDIQKYKRQIQELDFAIAMQEAYNTNIEQSHLIWNMILVYRVRTIDSTVRYDRWGPKPHTRMKYNRLISTRISDYDLF